MKFIRIAAISGVLAVALGAFGAHSLKQVVPAEQLLVFETGVRYHFYHTLALLFTGLLSISFPSKTLNMAASSFVAGICFFSGSLYILSTRSLIGIENTALLGPVTPLGGLLFIIGWVLLFIGAGQIRSTIKN